MSSTGYPVREGGWDHVEGVLVRMLECFEGYGTWDRYDILTDDMEGYDASLPLGICKATLKFGDI
jgi:hypothetical protein